VSLKCGFPCSSNDLEPFGSGMDVVIVPEIAAQKFPTRQPISGLGFV
jgi:hypothetical protein